MVSSRGAVSVVVLCGLALGGLSCACLRGRRAGVVEEPERLTLTPKLRARCVEILRAGLRSGEFWPSMHAAEGLTLGGHASEVRAFVEPKLEQESDDQKRCGLARELVRAGDRSKAAVMLDILAKQDAYAHVHAAESLYKCGEMGKGCLLAAAMGEKDNPPLQLMAAAAVARHGRDIGLRVLRKGLRDDDPKIQRIAVWAIARVGDASDIPQLRANLKRARDPIVRCQTEHALATLGDPQGRQALARNLGSSDPKIRTYAATFAGDAGMRSVAEQLIALLDDPNLDVRIRAAQSLLVLAKP